MHMVKNACSFDQGEKRISSFNVRILRKDVGKQNFNVWLQKTRIYAFCSQNSEGVSQNLVNLTETVECEKRHKSRHFTYCMTTETVH